jgi:FKBP-type peptidyl-prolyl cis-trans isomerase
MSTITTDSGLQYEDTTVGEGAEAKAGQHVTVHYTGWLRNDDGSTRAPSSIRARTATIRSSSRWAPARSFAAGTKACRA